MIKKRFKKRLAEIMAASMVFTMLAPTMPVYAADKSIRFDIISNSKGAVNPMVSTPMEITGIAGQNLTGGPVPDTGANGQGNSSIGGFEMPWWDYQWIDGTSGTTLPNPLHNNGITWGTHTYNLPGYKLFGWYDEDPLKNPTQTRRNKLPIRMPYKDTVYYAKYVSDGSTYDFSVEHISKAGNHAPINQGGLFQKASTPNPTKTLVQRQGRPEVITGYIAKLTKIQFGTEAQITDISSIPAGDPRLHEFEYAPADKTFTGEMINLPLSLQYIYEPDTNTKFRFVVENIILDSDGNIYNTVLDNSKQFSAEDTIVNVGPDSSLITPAAGDTHSRYLLVSTNATVLEAQPDTGNKKIPTITEGLNNVESSYKWGFNTTDGINANIPNAGLNTETGMISGIMPNQSMKVQYTYVPNPNYKLNVKVKYLDTDGNDLTSLVARESGTTVGADGAITVEGNPSSIVEVPYPSLTTQGYDAPGFAVRSGNASSIDDTSVPNKLKVGIVTSSITMDVTYPLSASYWQQVYLGTEGNGILKNRVDGTEYSNLQGNPIKLPIHAGRVSISDPSILPLPEAGAGYEFDGYYVKDSNVKVVDASMNLVNGTYSLANPYQLQAKFIQNANWRTLTFKFEGNNGTMSPAGPVQGNIYPYDTTGNARVIQWQEMDPESPTLEAEFLGVVPNVFADPGYEVRWYDSNSNLLTPTTDMASMPNGSVFIARAVSNTPLSLSQPTVDSSISTVNGAAQIQVTSFNPEPRVQYVVTDNAGNIVATVRNADLQSAPMNGMITAPGILPDTEYHVYEVVPDETVQVGDSISIIPSSDISSPAIVRTPVAVEPVIGVDATNPNKNQVTFRPVTPGMDYAVVDENGNVVMPWTTPNTDTLTIPGLDSGKNYKLVVKPQADTSSEPMDKMATGKDFVASHLNNVLTLVNPDDITVFSPSNLDFNNIPAGTVVTLEANLISGTEVFSHDWNIVLGNLNPATTFNDGATKFRFTMPRGHVVIEAVYTGNANWSKPVGTDTLRPDNQVGEQGNIGVANPNLNRNGNFRVVIDRSSVSAIDKNAIESEERKNYTGLWTAVVKIQEEISGVWTDLMDGTEIDTYVNMGALEDAGREYALYHLATGSNAMTRETGSFENQYTPVSNFNGLFHHKFVNGDKYIFGYTSGETYNVTIRNNRNNAIVTQFNAGAMDTVDSHSSSYNSAITTIPQIDVNGLTWLYKGLSTDREVFDDYDPSLQITSDLILYIFYENDIIERTSAADSLLDLILQAGNLTASQIVQIQSALDHANAVLNQNSPRKSSTVELESAYNTLRAAILAAGGTINSDNSGNSGNSGNSSHSGGSSGGSGGGGSIRRNGTTGKTRILSVGIDGNWELVNPETHEWVFNLESGNRTKGWNLLSYTYNGKLRSDWYYFADNNIMRDGWLWDDTTNKWYYLSEVHDGFFGKMNTGWHYDQNDNKWYYLDEKDGSMKTGWQNINGIWYYLNPTTPAPTWEWNADSGKWVYNNTQNVRPLGSMFSNEITPDGFKVDASGAWVK